MYQDGANPNIELHKPDELWNIQENDEIEIHYPLAVVDRNGQLGLAIAYDKKVKIYCIREGIDENQRIPLELTFEEFLDNYVNSNDDIIIPDHLLSDTKRQQKQDREKAAAEAAAERERAAAEQRTIASARQNLGQGVSGRQQVQPARQPVQPISQSQPLDKNTAIQTFGLRERDNLWLESVSDRNQMFGGVNKPAATKAPVKPITIDRNLVYSLFLNSKYVVRKAEVLRTLGTDVTKSLEIDNLDQLPTFLGTANKLYKKNGNKIRVDQLCFYMYIYFISAPTPHKGFNQLYDTVSNIVKNFISKYNSDDIQDQIQNMENDQPILSFVKFRTGTDVNKTNPRFKKKGTDKGFLIMEYSDKNESFCTTTDGKNYSCDIKYTPKYTHGYEFGPFTGIYNETMTNKDVIIQDAFKEQIIDKLKEGVPICIIGYGPSGSGKTSTLVRLEIPGQPTQNGVLLELAKDFLKVYKKCTLDIYEISSNKDTPLHYTFKFEGKDEGKTKTWFAIDGKVGTNAEVGYTSPSPRKIFSETEKTDVERKYGSDLKNISEKQTYWEYSPPIQKEFGKIILEFMIDRETEATLNNPDSSRSHAFFCVNFSDPMNESVKPATLILCDFAGVENVFDCDQEFVLNTMLEFPRYSQARANYNAAMEKFNDDVNEENNTMLQDNLTLGQWRENSKSTYFTDVFSDGNIKLDLFKTDDRSKIRNEITTKRGTNSNTVMKDKKVEDDMKNYFELITTDSDNSNTSIIKINGTLTIPDYSDVKNNASIVNELKQIKEKETLKNKNNLMKCLIDFGSYNFEYKVKEVDPIEIAYKDCYNKYNLYTKAIVDNANYFYSGDIPALLEYLKDYSNTRIKTYFDNKLKEYKEEYKEKYKNISEKLQTENQFVLSVDINIASLFSSFRNGGINDERISIDNLLQQYNNPDKYTLQINILKELQQNGITTVPKSFDYILKKRYKYSTNYLVKVDDFSNMTKDDIVDLHALLDNIIKIILDKASENSSNKKTASSTVETLTKAVQEKRDAIIPKMFALAYVVINEEAKSKYPQNGDYPNVNLAQIPKPQISEYMKDSCLTRGKEGKYINDTIKDLREFISKLVTRTNLTTPGFSDDCLPLQCNPNISNCFGINQYPTETTTKGDTEILGAIADIFDKYLTSIEKELNDLKICIFCVINLDPKANNPPPVPYIDISYIIYFSEILETYYNQSGDKSNSNEYIEYIYQALPTLIDELKRLKSNPLLSDNQHTYAKVVGQDVYSEQVTEKKLIEKETEITAAIDACITNIHAINNNNPEFDDLKKNINDIIVLLEVEGTNPTTVIGALQFTDSISKFGLYKGICNTKMTNTVSKLHNNAVQSLDAIKASLIST